MKAADAAVRVIIRRPHAYKFAADHEGALIPGLTLLDADGKVLDAIGLPADAADAVDLLRGGK
ncbi:MAG: hypothetical protein AAB434_10940 [Planctomycetota bacterium]